MPNPFSSYQIIDAGRIVRANVHQDHVRDDLNDLISVLDIIQHLPTISSQNEVDHLTRNTIKRIQDKTGLINLLSYYGYERNNHNEYVFQIARTTAERERRRSGIYEVEDLLQDLRSARDGSLRGFDEFIGIRHSRGSHRSIDHDESHQYTFRNAQHIENSNAATLALVKSFKQSLTSEHNPNPPPRFVRLRLARLLHKQVYPESRQFDEDTLDSLISQKVIPLKRNCGSINGLHADDICRECLIRTHFNEAEALKMLRNNPPNLEVPIEQPQTSSTVSLNNIMEPIRQQKNLINQQKNNNGSVQRRSQTDDNWEKFKHIVPAIEKLRQKGENNNANDMIFSQICRLLYAELLLMLGPQSSAKIEMFVRQICDSPVDRIENLDIATIKTILSSGDGTRITDNFAENAGILLSTPCPICFTYFPPNQMEAMYLCNHRCCLTCLKNYYRTTINSIQGRATLNSLTCFERPHPIERDIHHDFFMYLESKIKQWFKDDEPDLVRKYHDKIFEATRSTEIKRCGNSKCISSVYVDADAHIVRVFCQSCEFAQCARCCRKWLDEHKKMDCETYEQWLFDNDPDDPDNQAIRDLGSNAIMCPDCQEIFVNKPGGCWHYECPSCKADFCRICYEFFYSPSKTRKCPYDKCEIKNTIHAHCKANCYREIRDLPINNMFELLEENEINIEEELEDCPPPSGEQCITEECNKESIADSGYRYCESCYKSWLCLLIWNKHLEPWTLYEDNNLRRILEKGNIPYSSKASKNDLVKLCQEHLNETLGKPKNIKKRRN